MTRADERRVAKALQGKDFPAEKSALLDYAAQRGADHKTMEALRAVPAVRYDHVAEVENAVPQDLR